MAGSVYKVIEIIGTSDTSWEEAAKTAVEEAAGHLEDLRVAEVVQLDLHIVDNKVMQYRAKVNVSFKYHKDA
jgi:flavin-binding protein dodecin